MSSEIELRLPNKPQQARSRDRVEQILEATEKLMETHPLDQISFMMIAQYCGIGRPSIYPYFSTPNAIYRALGLKFLDEIALVFHARDLKQAAPTWQSTMDALLDITVDFYQRRPAARSLFFGDGSQGGLRAVDLHFDRRFADAIRNAMSPWLRLDATEHVDPAQIVVSISLSVLSISVLNNGYITPEYRDEAKRVTRAYLALFDGM